MAKKPARIDKRINVILLESDKHLGEKYEVVKVTPIFAKNVLLPKTMAVYADDDNLYRYHKKILSAQQEKIQKSDIYTNTFQKISHDNGLTFMMNTNEKGILYEKIDPTHIVNRIHELYNIQIPAHLIKMKKKITKVGDYIVPFQYASIEKNITISIKSDTSHGASDTASNDSEA